MSDSFNNLRFNRPPLFKPNFVRSLVEDAASSVTFTKTIGADMEDSVIGSTGSFKYDLEGMGVKNTQQLNVDWTKFENHTFFNSAQVKTNVAFDVIINKFPFDGTQKEHEDFREKMTGFENWLFGQYPKYKGYAFFSGSAVGETNAGTWITVKDIQGAAFPTVSRETTGISKLNPELESMTLESWVYIPPQANEGQTIVTKMSESSVGYDGFALTLSASSDTNFASARFYVASHSIGNSVSFAIPKGAWSNVAIVWDRNPNSNQIFAYVNQNLTGSSSIFEIGETFWEGNNLLIGSGSSFSFGGFSHTETTTFSGALDDFRIWHSVRTAEERAEWYKKAVYSSDALKLYFKFNEPSGSNTLLTLDSSGKSLHGQLNIAGNSLGVRQIPTASIAGADPMEYEKPELTPILFPNYPAIDILRNELLLSASYYDDNNPNLITKLVPPHYFIEGQVNQALETEYGPILTTLISGSDPRSVDLGGTQVLLSLMYVWAKYFDEMKLFSEAFSTLNWVDYDSTDTVPDQFLQFMAQQQGFTLPPLFVGASIEQFINRENIGSDISTNALSLQYIQNQIWRRILINLQDIVRSKGTIHSIKSFIRSTGIDPDNNFRIREFGGPTRAPLTFVRDTRSEISTMLNFISGGYAQSPYLSMSKIEPGYPYSSNVAGAANDYITSGSFTFEGTYRFEKNLPNVSQSLVRFMTTGSTVAEGGLPMNLVAVSGSDTITLYGRPGNLAGSQGWALALTGANIFDGEKWYISCGRERADSSRFDSDLSSSYFLRAAKNNHGQIIEAYFTSSFINEFSTSLGTVEPTWGYAQATLNASGVYLAIGSSSIQDSISFFCNDTSMPEVSRTTFFDGRATQLRFWSKYLDSEEWQEHVKNFKSLGVKDPSTNFNFVTNKTGSWERMRLDVSTDQPTTSSDSSGAIQLFDFSQNELHWSGTSFPFTQSVIRPERFFYSYISPKFDEGATTEKVRARSFLDYQNVLSSSCAQVAPLYRIELSEEPTDNTRFTIDFSIVDSLDQDIVNIFATLESLDSIIGNPELMFAPDYPLLENLRNIYFNRLTDKINLKSFFEFYKWFDTNIGVFIGQLIPRKTKYLGTNFVIESHMLERPKVEYHFSDIYLGDNNRHGLKDTILLRLLTGEFGRY